MGGFLSRLLGGRADIPGASSGTAASPEEVAVLETTAGRMVIAFWPEVAPGTVANFKKLAGEGCFDGTAFHRIVKGFMIQGGDPLTRHPDQERLWGTGDPGYSLKAEFNDRPHVRGVISMARGENPDSAGSQFFICLEPAPFLDGQYTAFGCLVEGEEVLLRIGDTPVTEGPDGERSRPLQRVEVRSVRIETRPLAA